MRIAVLSDIHGNFGALQAVLADSAGRRVDAFVNLGDVCSGPLQPAETAACLMALGMPTVRGNHEEYLAGGDPSVMKASDRAAFQALSPEQRAWLFALPHTLTVFDDILLLHGTPAHAAEYLLETVEPAGCRQATQQEVVRRLGESTAPLVLCGHSHLQQQQRLDDGRLIVNPGSVGLPAYAAKTPFPHRMEAGSPHARYAIVERKHNGWQAELLRVTYDWQAAAAQAERNGRANWAIALATGFAEK